MTRVQTVGEIGNQARARRLALGLTQEQVASRVGVSRRWVYQFESGRLRAEIGLFFRLASALDLVIEVRPVSPTDVEPIVGTIDLDAHLARFRHS